ncbi:MAG: hypothetical protein KUG77_21750 [Nannocystaceae bacterium]|nr:hypothetical protein [Nannocystaceae bacterium]
MSRTTWVGMLVTGACSATQPPPPPVPSAPTANVVSTPSSDSGLDPLPLALPGLFAEGLAWDAARSRLLVSGIVGQSVVAVELPSGESQPFAEPPRPWSVFGLGLDPEHDVVWAACSAVPQGRVLPDPVGPAALVAFSLEDGTIVAEHRLEDDTQHLFGDLTLAPGGTVFVTDTLGGGVYAGSLKADGLAEVVPAKTFRSIQGIAWVDSTTLIVADYPTGLVRIELDEHQASRNIEVLQAPPDLDLRGIDGLALQGRSLAAVQNGAQPPRVLRIELSQDTRTVESAVELSVPDPQAGEPTLEIFVGDALWVMQTDLWDRVFDADGRPRKDVELAAPTVARIPWKRRAP